jgi:uncharacterized repeat protein (TIGR01451 family)
VNKATVTFDNGAAPDPASASTEVQCAALTLTKTADAATVAAGGQIGFTLTSGNTGPGTATDAVLSDPLPAGSGVKWALDETGPSTSDCAVVLDAGSQVLTCAFGNLPAGAAVTVHLTSPTISTSCADYPNTARLAAANAPAVTARASTTVTTCLGVEAEPPVQEPPAPQPLATTGVGHLNAQLAWALALLLLGGLTLLTSRRRREQ